MNITVTGFSGYSSFTCNSWVAEKCLGRKTNFYLLEFLFSLFEIFSHFHMWVFVFLSHLSLLFFWYCILFTCCYLLRFRLFLSAILGFFGTRLFQLSRELTFDLHGFRTRIPTHWWFTLRSLYHSTIQACDGYLTNGANKPRHNDEHWSVSPVTQVLKTTLA